MLSPHRQSVLANACVKASVDPITRIPGTIYEPKGHVRLLGLISETSPSQQVGRSWDKDRSSFRPAAFSCLSFIKMEFNPLGDHHLSLQGSQEEYLDAGDGMLVCVKRAMKKPPESSRKGCSEPKNGIPHVDDISEAESDPDPNRKPISPIPEPNDTSLNPLPTPASTKHPRPGSFPFHWMWETFSLKGQGVFHDLSPEKTKKKWSPRTSVISVRDPPPTPVPDSEVREDSRGLGVSRSPDRDEGTGARPPSKRHQHGGLAPGSSLFPLYWKMEARSEARKRQLRQERRRWLQLTQQLLNLEDKPPRRGKFLSIKQLEEKLRAELLCLATEPEEPCPQKHPGKSRSQATKEEPTSKPTNNHKVPNFKNLQRRFQEQLVQRRDGDRAPAAKLTVHKPLRLQHANSSRALFADEESQDEEDPFHLWESNWRAQSCPEFHAPMARSVTRTKTSDKRQEANRLLLSEWERQERQEKRRAELRRAKEQQMQQDVAKCLATYRATGRSTLSAQRRREELRKQEKQRMEEYMQQLQEMRERVESRPYLFERVMQANARQAVERRFSKVLATLGINEETLWKKAVRPSSSKSSAKATHKRMEFLGDLTEST